MPLRPNLATSFPIVLASFVVAGIAAAQSRTERVSVDSSENQGLGPSLRSSISADGRFVAFESTLFGTALDIYVRDRSTGSTTKASVSSSGADGDGYSVTASISGEGRFVAFSSMATNFAPADGNGVQDVFVHDRQTGTTERVSVDSSGNEGDGRSVFPSISADGRYVAFASEARNLVPPLVMQRIPQVYVHDRQTHQTVLASIDGFGGPSQYASKPAICGDGHAVAFYGLGSHWFPGDVWPVGEQIYVRDFAAGATTRVSVNSQGVHARGLFVGTYAPAISADGRIVAFQSAAANLVPGDSDTRLDVFVHDRQTGTTTRASRTASGAAGNGDSGVPQLSADGRFVAFSSRATDLVPDDGNGVDDAFVHDRLTGSTTRVSVRTDDAAAGAHVGGMFPTTAVDSISGDGRFVAFTSRQPDLVDGDTNGATDIFVNDRAAPRPSVYCLSTLDSQGCLPAIASTGLASATGSAAFDVLASQVQSRRSAILYYSLASDRERSFGGVLCIAPPLRRAAVLDSGGNPGHDCTGSLVFDFNATIRSGVDPALVPGTVVYAQYFYRDPSAPSGDGTGLSDALRFAIQP